MNDKILIEPMKEIVDTSTNEAYTVINEIARGSYGIVVKALSKATNTFVALKLMNLDDMDLGEKEDAMREIQLMAKVSHPYILKYHGFFTQPFPQRPLGTK